MKYLTLLFCLALMLNCKNKEPETKKIEGEKAAFSSIPKVGTGWDIYLAGVYRYGPSIILNSNGTIDAWFAAEGDSFGEKIENFEKDDKQTAISITSGNTAAQRFLIAQPFYSLRVSCPNWGSASSNLTLTLYKWTTDYNSTIASKPFESKKYSAFKDNQNLEISDAAMIPAGDYLWVLSEPTSTAGVWKRSRSVSGVTNYFNGELVGGSYQAWCVLEKTTEGIYWDQAAYRRSSDGGKSWTKDEMVLKPTEGSRDQLSVCDPGTVKFNDYYYIGYTSTEDERGLFNHVYLGRSKSPAGPWEKWNGSGWGGRPQPVVTFDGDKDSWGAGEPSMVVLKNKIYFYYSWNDKGNNLTTTRVATADVTDTNWPGKLVFHGEAINKTLISGADHCDVKYRDDLKKFQAIHTASRLTANSYIVLWESVEGIKFEKAAELRDNLKPFLHNCGWSGDLSGHIDPAVQQYISYAYGPAWASWNTAWHPLIF